MSGSNIGGLGFGALCSDKFCKKLSIGFSIRVGCALRRVLSATTYPFPEAPQNCLHALSGSFIMTKETIANPLTGDGRQIAIYD